MKTTKRSLFAVGAVAAVSALVLSGCAAEEAEPTATATATQSEAPAEDTPAIETLTVWVDDKSGASLEDVADCSYKYKILDLLVVNRQIVFGK